MAYYNTCPNCGSNLDPGEQCDCQGIADRAQIGHNFHGLTKEEYTFFFNAMSEFRKTNPAAFVSTCALIQVMSNDEGNVYGFHYPQDVFLEAIQDLEDARKSTTEDPDVYIRAIALICDKWLKAAC